MTLSPELAKHISESLRELEAWEAAQGPPAFYSPEFSDRMNEEANAGALPRITHQASLDASQTEE